MPTPNKRGLSMSTKHHSITIYFVLMTLPSLSGSRSHSGCKVGDSDLCLSLLADRRQSSREGRKTISGRSSMASSISRRQRPSMPMLDRRPPAGLVGIPRMLHSLATPTLLASEVDRSLPLGCWETSSPSGGSSAVLAPPTGNGVLNQIPAGDGRESSREQAVPDDGALFHRITSCRGPGDLIPPLVFHEFDGRAASLTHKKKKKKKVEQSGGWTRPLLPRSSNRATTRKLLGLVTSVSGLKVVAGSWMVPASQARRCRGGAVDTAAKACAGVIDTAGCKSILVYC